MTFGHDVAIEVRAQNGRRPTIVLDGPLAISGQGDTTVALNGLVIAGDEVVVGDLRRIVLRHCTLVPGLRLDGDGTPQHPADPSLTVASDASEVEIQWSILGGLRTTEGASVVVKDSIIDATAPERVAFAALDGVAAGGTLRVERSTLIGGVRAHEISLASETIFWARLGDQPPAGWAGAVIAERRQAGCVRYSYVPPGARVPRRYRCQPDLAVEQAIDEAKRHPPAAPEADIRANVEQSIVPMFTSERYGDPPYAQLHRCCPEEIRTGAEDGSEMGVFAHLQQAQRERDLLTRMDEYLPFGLVAGITYCT